mmetsp:Transcript_14122/g.47123  ORF Transcript_14122/g.47123 Transcript_14122/m.47123 type:complete len:210 (-) Transcript_14122:1972-2601(-)
MSLRSAVGCSAKASPIPSHAGRFRRVCVQAKIQGIARSDSTPPAGLRLAGREPKLSAASSRSGVAARKKGTKSGSPRTIARYLAHDVAESAAIVARHLGSTSGAAWKESRSTAAVKMSSVRVATSGAPKLKPMHSPCSVMRKRPSIVAGGCARMARYVSGLPPRPTVPPLPWKKVTSTLNCFATASIFSCCSYCAHDAARRPASFALSE